MLTPDWNRPYYLSVNGTVDHPRDHLYELADEYVMHSLYTSYLKSTEGIRAQRAQQTVESGVARVVGLKKAESSAIPKDSRNTSETRNV